MRLSTGPRPRAAGRARHDGARLVLCLAAIVTTLACERAVERRSSGADTTRAAESPRAAETLAARWPAATPLLGGWIGAWGGPIPGFTADSMRLATADSLVFQVEHPIQSDFEDLDLRRQVWWVPSPDGRWSVDPNIGAGIVRAGDGIAVHREADSEVALIDLPAGVMKRVLFCGTPCSFDGARWIRPDVFLVTGYSEFEFGPPWRGGPTVHVVDLGRARLESYQGPGVDSVAHARGLAAIRDALRRGHPEFVRASAL